MLINIKALQELLPGFLSVCSNWNYLKDQAE